MSLTFNLILALFLLAPGLGIFAGVYAGGRRPFRPAAAEPGSIHALAVVAIGSLLCHALFAWFFVWMEGYCGTHHCISVDFDPNPYEIILRLRDALSTGVGAGGLADVAPPSLSSMGVAWLFSSLLLIGCGGFFLGLAAVWFINTTGWLRPVLYGWVDELLRSKPTKAHVFTAYVLTDTEADGVLLGYEGSLLDLRQSPSGEVRVIVLKDAEPFVVNLTDDSARRQPDPEKPKTIGVLTIEGAHIKNIAFRPFLDPRRLSDHDYVRMKEAGELDPAPEAEPVQTEAIVPETGSTN